MDSHEAYAAIRHRAEIRQRLAHLGGQQKLSRGEPGRTPEVSVVADASIRLGND
jgi:hypothetical protein